MVDTDAKIIADTAVRVIACIDWIDTGIIGARLGQVQFTRALHQARSLALGADLAGLTRAQVDAIRAANRALPQRA